MASLHRLGAHCLLDGPSGLVFHPAMGRFLWAGCFALLLLLGFATSARADDLGAVIPVCVRPEEIPDHVARNGWAFSPSGTHVIRMKREEFRKESRNRLIYVFIPGAPPGNTKLLPIRYHHLPCAPADPSASAPVAPPPRPAATPKPPPAPPAAAGGRKGAAPDPAKEKPATSEKGEAPPPLPQPIVYPGNEPEPEPKPRPPSHGVTTHWPSTVLPVVRRRVDKETKGLPVANVLPSPSVDTRTRVLPMASVPPRPQHASGPGGKGDGGKGDGGKGDGGKGDGGKGSGSAGSSSGKAPNKVAQKTTFEKIAEQVVFAGAVANTQMNADLNRPDGKRFGIVGGTNPNGPNTPVAQASAGVVLVTAAALSAGAGKLVKRLKTALVKKTPLLYSEMANVGKDVAEELATKIGPTLGKNGAADVRAGLAEALNQNGAIGPYSVMRQFTEKLGGKWQAHHILEQSMAKKFGLGNADKVPSVILTQAQHKTITAELAAKTPDARSAQELWKVYQEVYKDYPPHWLEAIKSYFVKTP